MESLAIAVRTYTVGNLRRHRADGFDLCDQTHCQVMRTATAVTEQAALATAGQILQYAGQPATVYYSASCGGRSEKPSNVWPGADDPPYLPSRSDSGCGGFPQWSTELNIADLQRALRAAGYSGALKNVRVAARNESGRASRIALDGLTPGEISGQDLRAAIGRTLGWQYLQSASFELKRSGDAFRFAGHGAGHGVGMCVIGSAKLATGGETAAQILGRYFPGTIIGSVGSRFTAAPAERLAPETPAVAASAAARSSALPPDVVVSLPQGDEAERGSLEALVRRERDSLGQTLAVRPPQTLALRFHSATEDFERVTGRPWFVLAARVGTESHYAPLSVLRERGVLDRAVRHEIVHQMADDVLRDRPAWVREGAAMHFSDGRSVPPTARVACPDDNELMQPLSAGAFAEASRRARLCFERQLTAGRAWTEVR
jgi:SpoIID/LytB domain protein